MKEKEHRAETETKGAKTMTTLRIHGHEIEYDVLPVEVRPSREGGVDYTQRRVVMLRKGNVELQWCRAGSYFVGASGGACNKRDASMSVPSGLVIADYTESRVPSVRKLFEGGRLTQSRIEGVQNAIVEAFGPGTPVLVCREGMSTRNKIEATIEIQPEKSEDNA